MKKSLIGLMTLAVLGCSEPKKELKRPFPELEFTQEFQSQFSQDYIDFTYMDSAHHKISGYVAHHDPLYQKNVEEIQNIIFKKLHGRTKLEHYQADYSTDPAQVFTLPSKIQLTIMNKYIDFFDSFAEEDFSRMFVDGKESGGIIHGGKKGIGLAKLTNVADYKWGPSDLVLDDLDPTQGYSAFLTHVFPMLGTWHTHSYSQLADHNVAGPSGKISHYFIDSIMEDMMDEFYTPEGSDLYSLRHYFAINRFTINTVFTEVEPNYYNVDMYLLDASRQQKVPLVFDLGVWDYRKD